MSEEEAIKILNTYKGNLSQQKKNPKITKAIDRIIDALEEKNIFLDLYNKEEETSHFLQSQLDIANAKLVEEKEKNKELEKENKQLNLVRLQYLVSSFPDNTETYKKYRKELDELLKEE